MNFTHDWFSNNIPNFEICMAGLPSNKSFLEIGAFEGRATCWVLEHGLSDKGSIVCIDPYEKSDYDPTIDMPAVEARFWSNIKEATRAEQKVSLMRMPSSKALAELATFKNTFDFIYVDGSHAPDDAFADGLGAWKLLNQGGVMLFDDYLYPHENTSEGIDRFLDHHKGKYEIIINNYQLAVRKI